MQRAGKSCGVIFTISAPDDLNNFTQSVFPPPAPPQLGASISLPKGLHRYVRREKVGEGSYGKVYKCEDLVEKRYVAIKVISWSSKDEGVPASAIREVSLLLELHHPNVIQLLDILSEDSKLLLVFEYLEKDLKSMLDQRATPVMGPKLKDIMYQLLSGLHACHSRRIVHRDIKLNNILVSKDEKTVKIADLGLGRPFSMPLQTYTHDVMTLLYRAPEILLGEAHYLPAVDMWSMGCVLGELALGRPLFMGENEFTQLIRIFEIMGTPNEELWPGVSLLANYNSQFPKWAPQSLAALIPVLEPEGIDILAAMLRYKPESRITAEMALQHSWFDDVRDECEARLRRQMDLLYARGNLDERKHPERTMAYILDWFNFSSLKLWFEVCHNPTTPSFRGKSGEYSSSQVLLIRLFLDNPHPMPLTASCDGIYFTNPPKDNLITLTWEDDTPITFMPHAFVIFKVKCTNPNFFRIHPCFGALPLGESSTANSSNNIHWSGMDKKKKIHIVIGLRESISLNSCGRKGVENNVEQTTSVISLLNTTSDHQERFVIESLIVSENLPAFRQVMECLPNEVKLSHTVRRLWSLVSSNTISDIHIQPCNTINLRVYAKNVVTHDGNASQGVDEYSSSVVVPKSAVLLSPLITQRKNASSLACKSYPVSLPKHTGSVQGTNTSLRIPLTDELGALKNEIRILRKMTAQEHVKSMNSANKEILNDFSNPSVKTKKDAVSEKSDAFLLQDENVVSNKGQAKKKNSSILMSVPCLSSDELNQVSKSDGLKVYILLGGMILFYFFGLLMQSAFRDV